MINFKTIYILFGLIILIIGCSSKDWNGPTGETNDPHVISVIPPNGSTNIATNENIVAFFNKDLDTSTINMGNFYVYNYNEYVSATVGTASGTTTIFGVMPPKIPGIHSYDAGQRAAIFSPRYLNPETYYLVQLTTGIKDSTGRAMLNGYRWYFTTGSLR